MFGNRAHCQRSISKFPDRPMRKCFPGGITVVALYSVTTAGPRQVAPCGHAPHVGQSCTQQLRPTADTGGLVQNHAPAIYAYPNPELLFAGENAGGEKAALPKVKKVVTERPR